MLRNFFYLALAGVCATARAAAPAGPPPAASPAASSSSAPAPAPASPSAATSGLIRVEGSDLLETAIGEPLSRYAKQFHLNVFVDMFGSPPALDDLKSGKAQLGIVAVPVGENPAPDGFKAIPFCFAADYIIVNSTNPLTALTLRDLGGVFGSTGEDIMYWNQLKLSGDWITRPVTVYSTSPDDGDVVELLQFFALDRKSLRPNVHVLNTPEEVVKAVANSPDAIGLIGYDPGPKSNVKVLLISPDNTATANKPAATPTPENILSGDYPLRLPFYLVYKPADLANIKRLLSLLLAPSAAPATPTLFGDTVNPPDIVKSLRDQHFIPLPETNRQRALLELDSAP